MKSEFNMENVKAIFGKGKDSTQELMSGQTGKYEVNLVPDVKTQMLKQQHIRNIVFFICLIVAGASIGIVAIFGMIKGGQDITMALQDNEIEGLSEKMGKVEQLSEFLTIQDQLGKVSQIEEKKNVMSRIFNILVMMQPQNKDTVKFSELNLDMKETAMDFEAQANAGEDSFDYRVLESFKKNVGLMTYDYGRYVDSDGNEIPTRCVIETDNDGNYLNVNGNLYAIWKRGYRGCDPQRNDYEEGDGDEGSENVSSENSEDENEENIDEKNERIWRTPQFEKWYEGKTGDEDEEKAEEGGDDKSDGEKTVDEKDNDISYISEDGVITGIPHFESKCFKYSRTEDENGKTKWVTENDCKLTAEDMEVTESTNARNDDDELVLRFSASVNFDSEVFKFANKHLIAVAPFEQNVTDSYRQVNGMDKIFTKKAKDCSADDNDCKNNEGDKL